jgi:hypothetical protein
LFLGPCAQIFKMGSFMVKASYFPSNMHRLFFVNYILIEKNKMSFDNKYSL